MRRSRESRFMNQYLWTAWSLTRDGWRRGKTVDSATVASRDRPEGSLLVMLAMKRGDDPRASNNLSVLYRSPDFDAVSQAMSVYGPQPTE